MEHPNFSFNYAAQQAFRPDEETKESADFLLFWCLQESAFSQLERLLHKSVESLSSPDGIEPTGEYSIATYTVYTYSEDLLAIYSYNCFSIKFKNNCTCPHPGAEHTKGRSSPMSHKYPAKEKEQDNVNC